MKKQIFSKMTLVVALVAGLTACSNEDNIENTLSKQKVLINVEDAQGFKASDGTPQTGNMTRAVPAQNQQNEAIERGTIFEVHDSIGIFVVNNSTHEIEQANVPYYYSGQLWNSSSEVVFSTSGDYSYYAYFPYKQNPTGLPTVGTTFTGSDAAALFSDLISNWEVKDDQSLAKDYQASDLMVGKATVTPNSGNIEVNFQMAHQFGLVVLDMGQIKHVLRAGNYYWFDDVNKKCKTSTGQQTFYKPWFIHGEYRAIVPLGTQSKFCATDDEWSINAKVTEKGYYQLYNIGYSANVENSGIKYFDLQLGDIYYNDGSLLHVTADNVDARMARQANAVGFVVFVSDGSAEDQKVVDPRLDENGMLACQYSHGLVMRIRAHNTKENYTTNIGMVTKAYKNAGNFVKTYYSIAAAVNDYDGIVSTNQVYHSGNSTYDAWYDDAHPGPSGTNVPNSGWFVPGMGQIVHSLLQTGAITETVYSSMLANKNSLNDTYNVTSSIWQTYMENAIGTSTISDECVFTWSNGNYGLLSSTYYPNSDSYNDTHNWIFEINAGAVSELYADRKTDYGSSRNSTGYTPMMLAF